ncbi:MAG TPA: division plane positioning ATPase MipZ [Pseudolabrys sp.]|jgi:chromosome partitioning protein|nr:division plane positioning ATPase MipZ [Pseudolabrys sp.]
MIPGKASQASTRVIVVGNEKGGSGKSTVAIHIAIALMKAGQSVATVDLDLRQRSLTRYIENRRAWAAHVGRELETPEHFCLDGNTDFPTVDDRAAQNKALNDALARLADTASYIVIDTAGHDSYLARLAHSLADTLVTPLNDSFVDLDVIGTVDPETFAINGISHYAQMVQEARRQRQLVDDGAIDWIVLRNRLSSLGSRNKRLVGEGLQDLSERLNFRCIDGLAERVIFREFYPRGLTAVDDLNEITLGTRPTMSHASARLEMETLLSAVVLGGRAQGGDAASRNAA